MHDRRPVSRGTVQSKTDKQHTLAQEVLPAQPGDKGNGNHDWNKDRGDVVSKGLDGCFCHLGISHQAHNLGQRSVRADTSGAHLQQACQVDCASNDCVTLALGDWESLACQHGLVHM